MFTGIVGGCYQIVAMDDNTNVLKLTLEVPNFFTKKLKVGASVAIDGICLTVTKLMQSTYNNYVIQFDVIEETLNCTYLKYKKVGNFVNLERSLKLGDELGGHILSGHISDTAVIRTISSHDTSRIFEFMINEKWAEYIFPKTSIAVDGVSLTIVEVSGKKKSHEDQIIFSTHIIPETLRTTTFIYKRTGDLVNIELNSMIKTIVETVKNNLDQVEQ